MYNLLSSLRLFISSHEEIVQFASQRVIDEPKDFSVEDQGKTKELKSRLKDVDVYILLESIYFASNNFNENILVEIEEKLTDVVYRWVNTHNIADKKGRVLSEDEFWLYILCEEIEKTLINSIDRINEFCARYLEKLQDNLFSGFEYLTMFRAHIEYHDRKNRYDDLRLYGPLGLTKEDHFFMTKFELDEDKYIQNIIKEGIQVDLEAFDDEESSIIETNEDFIKALDFKICFVSDRNIGNPNIRYGSEVIEAVWSYLTAENKIEGGNLTIFTFIISHKRLPSRRDKLTWNSPFSDARLFVDFFDLTDDIFNSCFKKSDGALLDKRKHKRKKDICNAFLGFLNKLDGNFE